MRGEKGDERGSQKQNLKAISSIYFLLKGEHLKKCRFVLQKMNVK